MNERPILFNGEMVRAILDGRKTQTRRILKPQPPQGLTCGMAKFHDGSLAMLCDGHYLVCKYGQPGDRLWVRESFWEAYKKTDTRNGCVYRADYLKPTMLDPSVYHHNTWTPSIHMPHWASRITLEIINVRVERLKNMSVNDCYAEGILPSDSESRGQKCFDAVNAFEDLWNKIYGPGFWDKNPWVWVIEFRRVV